MEEQYTNNISKQIIKFFLNSPLTLLLIIIIFTAGIIGILHIPREEEPQISVPMVDIFLQAEGLQAIDAVELVTKPLETIIKAIPGVEHVYSQTEDNSAIVTARFYVGTNSDDAILRIHEKIRAHLSEIPHGIPMPLIISKGIDDVASMVINLSPKNKFADRWRDDSLYELARQLQGELIKINDIGFSYIVGGRNTQLRIEPIPEKLALYGITCEQVIDKVQMANSTTISGKARNKNQILTVIAGHTLQDLTEIGLLLIDTKFNRPVYLKDVANITLDGKNLEQRSWFFTKANDVLKQPVPAVDLAIAKRPNVNAVILSKQVQEKLKLLRNSLIPEDVEVTITRDYGKSANDKANRLLEDLFGATLSVVLLMWLALGWREAMVMGIVIPATILATIFVAWLMGYTINRVSLFALIFSIGILVDDAIVFVENIVRHWQLNPKSSRLNTSITAVIEVGAPTIIATLTIIIALLPMLSVSGLMGPYMSPIPINASIAMLLSLVIAFTIAPWLLVKFSALITPKILTNRINFDFMIKYRLACFYHKIATKLVYDYYFCKKFLITIIIITISTFFLFFSKLVTIKMLPFDNKSELMVQIDLPAGSALEATERILLNAVTLLKDLQEVKTVQFYAGTSAPFNFNGLVRHSYIRNKPNLGELQINLLPKEQRNKTSHEIAAVVRNILKHLILPIGSSIKIIEVPPGPPVLATLLAEIYGPNVETRQLVAKKLKTIWEDISYITDISDLLSPPADCLRVNLDQAKLNYYKVSEQEVYTALKSLLGSTGIGYSHRKHGTYPIEISIELAKKDKLLNKFLLSTPISTINNGNVQLGDIAQVTIEKSSYPIFRHNGYEVELLLAEVAGKFEAPIYAMLATNQKIKQTNWNETIMPEVKFHGQPKDESKASILWDGEWEITYTTFLDMGKAFVFAILGIYLLLIIKFGNFSIPLIILVPIPLVLSGIILGHWLIHIPFTATSMIGLIALSGIVVRNSLLLVEFIEKSLKEAMDLPKALLEAGTIRITPILLTAAAAMIGSIFMFHDPIFQGLAVSLFFGLMSSTVLTLLVIPAVYVIKYRHISTKG